MLKFEKKKSVAKRLTKINGKRQRCFVFRRSWVQNATWDWPLWLRFSSATTIKCLHNLLHHSKGLYLNIHLHYHSTQYNARRWNESSNGTNPNMSAFKLIGPMFLVPRVISFLQISRPKFNSISQPNAVRYMYLAPLFLLHNIWGAFTVIFCILLLPACQLPLLEDMRNWRDTLMCI